MAASQRPTSLAHSFWSHDPLPLDAQERFLDSIWPQSSGLQYGILTDFESYFNFVQQEREPSLSSQHVIETLDDVLAILNIIRTNPASTFADIRSLVAAWAQRSRPHATISQAALSIELAVRLWLMSSIRNLMPLDRRQLETTVPWPDGLGLRDVLSQYLKTQPGDPNSRYPEFLNASDMNKIGGVRIEWTNDLTSHLTMKGSVIYIFHNVSVLRRMRDTFSG
jgi:hypothetical protein